KIVESASAKAERHANDGADHQHLEPGEDVLKLSRLAHAYVVQSRNENGRENGPDLSPGDRERMRNRDVAEKAERVERSQDAHHSNGDGRDGRGLGDYEPCPRIQEPGERAVAVAHIDVFATGLWLER